jgi:hypothetical protein
MDWIAAISTTSLFALILWLSRNLIITRLTRSVSHEYDTKLANIKADLVAKASQIDALRSGVLSGVSARQASIFQRRLAAIEELWDAVVLLGPAKGVSAWMAAVKFEAAAKEAAKNPQFREIFLTVGKIDLDSLRTSQALKARPFVSPLAWAYYSAYQAIVFHAVTKMDMLKKGLDMPEIIDTKSITELVKVALPHQVQYIEQYGPSAFHHLLEELETKLLLAFQLMLKGDDSDEDTLEKAASIIKKSEILMSVSNNSELQNK